MHERMASLKAHCRRITPLRKGSEVGVYFLFSLITPIGDLVRRVGTPFFLRFATPINSDQLVSWEKKTKLLNQVYSLVKLSWMTLPSQVLQGNLPPHAPSHRQRGCLRQAERALVGLHEHHSGPPSSNRASQSRPCGPARPCWRKECH